MSKIKDIAKDIVLASVGIQTKDGEIKTAEKPNYAPQEGLTEKFCKIHGRMEKIVEFGKDRWMKDGYANYCKEGYRLRWVAKDPKFAGKKHMNPAKN